MDGIKKYIIYKNICFKKSTVCKAKPNPKVWTDGRQVPFKDIDPRVGPPPRAARALATTEVLSKLAIEA